MAIIAIQGFDNYALDPAAILSPSVKGFFPGTPNSLNALSNGFTAPTAQIKNTVEQITRADGSTVAALKMTLVSTLSSQGLINGCLFLNNLVPAELQTTGTAYVGVRVKVGPQTGTYGAVLINGTQQQSYLNGAAGLEAYIEVAFTYTTGSQSTSVWINGTLSRTIAGSPQSMVVGNYMPIPTLSGSQLFANIPVGTNSSAWVAYSDIYVAYDAPTDPNPTGRLGPVHVNPLPIAAVTNVDKFKAVGGTDITGNLTKPVSITEFNSPFVTTDPRGSTANISFTKPTLGPNETGIIAVQTEMVLFEPSKGAATINYQHTDGTNTTTKKSIDPVVFNDTTSQPNGSAQRIVSSFSKNLAGNTWTPDDIANIKLQINSNRR